MPQYIGQVISTVSVGFRVANRRRACAVVLLHRHGNQN